MYLAFITSQWMSRFFIWSIHKFRGDIGQGLGFDGLQQQGFVVRWMGGVLGSLWRDTNDMGNMQQELNHQPSSKYVLSMLLELQIKPLVIVLFFISMRLLKSLFIWTAKRIDVFVCNANYRLFKRNAQNYGTMMAAPPLVAGARGASAPAASGHSNNRSSSVLSVNAWDPNILSGEHAAFISASADYGATSAGVPLSLASMMPSRIRSSSINGTSPNHAAVLTPYHIRSRSIEKVPGTPSRHTHIQQHSHNTHLSDPSISVSSVAHFCQDEIRYEKFEDKNQILTFQHDDHEHHQSSLIPVASFMMDLFYFIYYRLIFTSITSWSVFAITHALHLLMEVVYNVVICSYTWFKIRLSLSNFVAHIGECLCCRTKWWCSRSSRSLGVSLNRDILEYDVPDSLSSDESDTPFNIDDEDCDGGAHNDVDCVEEKYPHAKQSYKNDKMYFDYLFYRVRTMTVMSLSVHAQILSIILFVASGVTLQFCTPRNIVFYHAPQLWSADRMLVYPAVALVTELGALMLIRLCHRVLFGVKNKEWFLGAKLLSSERLFCSLIVVVLHISQDVFVSRIEIEI
eukprot:CAMPEP_0117448742 /NCGR_PEP_ID=MMETSP0759-20121206/7566_1 /TAXON_ID=63605 /ORGANISM="Percolomonas cosmopolitus, Strain WS" /LENGTH=569 /DNA_ID=CAMNT_0005241155 /DNA_START=559 /DNA_END=2268 /DNA_ORIENTATION=-